MKVKKEVVMKVLMFLLVMAAFVCYGGVALAAGSADVVVNATVLGSCSFSGNGQLDFPALDPAGAGVQTAAVTTQVTLTCTSGAPYTIDDGGHVYEMTDGTNVIAYTLNMNPALTGIGAGVAENLIQNATVAQADYQNKPAGSYTDTVTFTITP